MKYKQQYFLVVIMLLSACSVAEQPPPDAEKVKVDLVGQHKACGWGFNSITEFRKLDINSQVTASDIAEYDLDIEVESGSDDRIITARAIYKKQADDW